MAREADDKVHRACQDITLQVAIGRDKTIGVVHEVATGDERKHRRVLNQVECLIAQRRQDDLKRLRQNNVAIRLHATKALRKRRFHLTARYRLDTRTDNLGHIGSVIQADA